MQFGIKGCLICRAVQDEGGSHALQAHGGDQRHIGPIVARNLANSTASSGSIGIQTGHGDSGAGFIDKDQVAYGQISGLFAPSATLSFLLLACSQRLFFRVQPKAIRALLMEAVLTLLPVRSNHIWQCSSRVASGWLRNCSRSPALRAGPLTAGRPVIGLGRT